MTIAKNYDDNRNGAVLTKIAQGDLIGLPFAGESLSVSAGASITNGSFASDNPIPGRPWSISIPAGAQGYASLTRQLWGRQIGLRYRRHFSQPLPNMTFIVDGEAFPIKNVSTRKDTIPFSYPANDYGIALPAEDLATDGPHTVSVHVAGDLSVAVTNLVLFGWLVERSRGYIAPASPQNSWSTQTLSTTSTTIAANTSSTRDVAFYNPGVTDRVVTIYSGTTAIQNVKVPAGTTQRLPTAQPWVLANFKVAQDAGADVVMSWLGEGFTQ